MIQKSKSLEKVLYDFTHLKLGGKIIRCPYWKNKIKKQVFGPHGGKGTPQQIIKDTFLVAQDENLNLHKLSKSEIIKFMKTKKIGIDCSGLVYQMLDVLDKEKGGKGIKKKVFGVCGFGITKTNAHCLTNRVNSVPIDKIKDIKIGDLIRLKQGKHLGVILRINKINNQINELTYAHSSNKTQISGVHTGKIKITDPRKSIWQQSWPEKLKNGHLLVEKYLNPQKGDGVRRVRWS